MKKQFVVVDLFCGAGGASHAAVRAVQDIGGAIKRFVAVNHWDSAIATHKANHDFAVHYCESVANVKPRAAVPGGRVHLLLAGPECTFHSNAAGDRVINDQSRIAAWSVLNWLHDLYVDNAVIENVPEFQDWGPLNADGRKNKRLKGQTFIAYLNAIRALGYRVDWRVLRAADYGDPTSRERLFILARRGNKPIIWPEPTHARPQALAALKTQPQLLPSKLKPYRTAREIIDWSLPGASVFNRKKPLSDNTMRRIMAGLYKFGLRDFILPNEGRYGGNAPRAVDEPLNTITANRGGGALVKPFLIKLYNKNDAVSVDSPLPSVTAGGQHLGLAQPFLVGAGGPEGHRRPRSIDVPFPTVTGTPSFGLAQPFVIGQQSGARPRSVDEPLPTIATAGAISFVNPYVLSIRGGNDGYLRGVPVDAPLQAVTTENPMALIQPYLVFVSQDGEREYPIDDPLPTVTSVHNQAIVHPFILATDQANSRGAQVRSVDDPLGTITTKNRTALARPYLVQYYGNGSPASVDEPLNTVTTKDRFALCLPVLSPTHSLEYLLLDILFRMLEPRELAAAMSFPKSYFFVSARPTKHLPITKKETVKMIGNAWPGETGFALCRAALS